MTEMYQVLIPINPCGADPVSAAAYLAWIAYPKRDQKANRDRFVKCVGASYFKLEGKHPPQSLRGIKRDKIMGGIRPGLERITTRRIPAVVMALRQMGLDPAKGRIGLNESARAYAGSDAMIEFKNILKDGKVVGSKPLPEPDNVRRDVWRDSLPALAMTIALPLSLLDNTKRRHPIDLLQSGAWVSQAILDARQIAPVIRMYFKPNELMYPKST